MQNGKDLSITQDETTCFLCSLNLNTFPTFDLLNLSVHIYGLGFIIYVPCNHFVNASLISTWLHLGDVASLCIGRSSALTFMVSHDGISISWAHSVKSQGLKINSILQTSDFLFMFSHGFMRFFSDLFFQKNLRGPSSTCIIFTRCILCGELCGTESAATPWAGLYLDWRSTLKGAFCKLARAKHENLEFPGMFQRCSALFVDLHKLQALVARNARSGSNSEVSCLDSLTMSSRSRTGLLLMLSRTLPMEAFRRHH